MNYSSFYEHLTDDEYEEYIQVEETYIIMSHKHGTVTCITSTCHCVISDKHVTIIHIIVLL